MNSEEQYKHIEQKIVEAANQNEYPFTEEAWKRMELLLVKKDKKRRFFFGLFPLLLVLSVGGGMAIYNTSKSKKNIAAIQKEEIKSSSIATPQSTPANETVTKLEVVKDINTISVDKKEIDNTSKKQAEQIQPQNQQPNFLLEQTDDNSSKPTFSNKSTSQKKSKSKSQKSSNNNEEEFYESNKTNLTTNKKAKVKITSAAMGEDEDPTVINEEKKANKKTNEIEEKEVIEAKPSATEINKKQQEQEIKKEQVPTKADENKKEEALTKKKEEKKSKKKQSQFFVTASLGAEVNTTKLLSFNNTTIVPRYGAAIGYQFSNRLSVLAGFYVSGKKYIAKKEDYNFKSNSYLASLDITKIDANCKVYEIPLAIQYNFISKPNVNVFGMVGVSSYIMKKEDYMYDYQYGGVSYTAPLTYTKNTHLLAAATVSLGIEKSISKKINLQFSPRISIPLGGVGQGEMKLFSSGIDFGVKYYPFKK
jgi:hypothetical protein